MHNRISFNQLAGWINLDESLDSSIEQTEIVNDYFNCLIECDDDQASCCLLYTSDAADEP